MVDIRITDKLQKEWMTIYNVLTDYINSHYAVGKNGSLARQEIEIPYKTKTGMTENGKPYNIGVWVHTQQQAARNNKLTPERKELLEKIGIRLMPIEREYREPTPLRLLMDEKGITKADISEQTGITPSSLHKYELGTISLLRIHADRFIDILNVLGETDYTKILTDIDKEELNAMKEFIEDSRK